MCTRQSPKGNMGNVQSTVPDTVAVETNFFCCFPLALTDICPWRLLSFVQISLKTVKSKPPTIPFGVVACSLSDNLSQHSCIFGLVFFVLKSFLGIARQWTRGKFAIFCLAIPRKDLSTKKTKTNIEKK